MLSYISDKNTSTARPEDLARRRAMAQAMIRSGTELTPQDPWEGLAAVARALSGNYADYKLGQEEAAGRASGRAAYQPIVDALRAGKSVDNTALVGAMSNDWLSDSERNVLGTYFKQNLEANAPLTKWQQAQIALDEKKIAQDNTIAPHRSEDLDYLKSKGGPEGAPELGLNPQYGVDAKGNPVPMQIGKDGGTLSKAPIRDDAETYVVPLDPIARQPFGTVPKPPAGVTGPKRLKFNQSTGELE